MKVKLIGQLVLFIYWYYLLILQVKLVGQLSSYGLRVSILEFYENSSIDSLTAFLQSGRTEQLARYSGC